MSEEEEKRERADPEMKRALDELLSTLGTLSSSERNIITNAFEMGWIKGRRHLAQIYGIRINPVRM